MSGQLRQIVEGVLLVFATLLPIVNPFGGAPVFLAMTADCTPELRKALATRVALNAFVLLFCSVFVGTYVLEFFGLSVPIVQVAGGLVVCALGWDLLRQETTTPGPAPPADADASDIATRAFYPLTLPLTVGPGTISVAITLGANHSHSMRSLLANGTSEIDRRDADCGHDTGLLSLRRPDAARTGRHGDERAGTPLRLHPALHWRADPVERRERARGDAARAEGALRATAVRRPAPVGSDGDRRV